jgi:4-hydroxy-tetrahydrodipicolinate reductase
VRIESRQIWRRAENASVLIDFTRPEGTLAHLRVCRELGVKAVIGTTGFSDAQKARSPQHAKDIAIVMAPNMSVGVNVTLKLLEMAAKAWPPATTSKSSRHTIATRSTHPRAPHSRWAK